MNQPNPKLYYDEVVEFADKFSGDDLPILKELIRETNLKTVYPQMLTLPHQGKFLQFISKVISPTNILDLGTFTGYSAICLCQGLKKNGKLITVDYNEETTEIAKKYFIKSGFSSQIESIIGNALDVINTLNSKFDIIYIDTNKSSYKEVFNASLNLLEEKGIIIIDNVLWYLKVVAGVDDLDTRNITEFNTYIQNRQDLENYLLPVGDGFMIVRKK